MYIMRYISFILVVYLFHLGSCVNISEMMIKAKIVPDVIPIPPTELLEVRYWWGVVIPGKRYHHMETIMPPTNVKWNALPNKLYTLYMSCITKHKVPFDKNTYNFNFTHGGIEYQNWVIINIPADQYKKGNELHEYHYPGSPPEHDVVDRFTFLIYEQSYKIENVPPPRKGDRYMWFEIPKTSRFALKYNLGNPIAGNYFLTHWVTPKITFMMAETLRWTNEGNFQLLLKST